LIAEAISAEGGTIMTDPNYTALLLVVDRSGSMQSIRSAMVEAMQGVLTDQSKEPGKLTVDVYSFNDAVTRDFHMRDVADVVVQIEPNGNTALFDAIGRSVTEFGRVLSELPEDERPDTVQVIVVTDGMENSSTDWSRSAVRDLVLLQKNQYNWDFVFLGANQDAVMTGEGLGFDRGSSMSFDPSAGGVDSLRFAQSRYTSDLRRKQKRSFMMEERLAALEAENDALRRLQAENQAKAADESPEGDTAESA
jgi:hypothetical protein